jgi:hypothetical protein
MSAVGKSDSEIRKRADIVLKQIIKKALNTKRFSYQVKRIDIEGGAGDINQAIIDSLCTADLIIADLTGLNPNVFYEIGIRQAWKLPLIPICSKDQPKLSHDVELCVESCSLKTEAEKPTELPFDVQVLCTVPYSLKTKKAISKTIVEIRKQIRSILNNTQKNVVFEDAFKKIGKQFYMGSVYRSFRDALGDAYNSVFQIKGQLPQILVLREDRKTVESFRANVVRIFVCLSDKLFVYEQIALGPAGEKSDDELVSLIEHSREVIQKADKISEILSKGQFTITKYKMVENKINVIMNTINKIAQKIPNA